MEKSLFFMSTPKRQKGEKMNRILLISFASEKVRIILEGKAMVVRLLPSKQKVVMEKSSLIENI